MALHRTGRRGPEVKKDVLRRLKQEAWDANDDWTKDFADSLIDSADRGLTDRQKQTLYDKLRKYDMREEIRVFGGDPRPEIDLPSRHGRMEEILSSLLSYARKRDDTWLENFVLSAEHELNTNGQLSPKQMDVLEDKMFELDDELDIFSRAAFLKDELIRLGSEHPDLQPNIRAVLDRMSSR